MLKLRVLEKSQEYREKVVHTYETEVPTSEAKFAFILLEKWGMICSVQDGEDSSGRAKIRSLTPEEIVDKAFTISVLAHDQARKRGMFIEVPDLDEINKKTEV